MEGRKKKDNGRGRRKRRNEKKNGYWTILVLLEGLAVEVMLL